MKSLCDLHTHSVFSDGTDTPAEILRLSVAAGLSAVALCDHNTVDGLPDFLASADGKPLTAIPGAEFSVDFEGTEVHLLGLFLPESRFAEITERMQEVMARKEQSNIELIESLRRAGYMLDYNEIKNATPNGKINRAHIAADLTKRGYTGSIKEAFQTLLSPAAGHYREPKRIDLFEMIDYLSSIHAAPVLAHPLLNLSVEDLTRLLPRAKQTGMIGMECVYSLYDSARTQTSMALADTYGLLYSGGSDYHGANKPDIQIGVGRGDLRIPAEWASSIRAAIR